MKNNFKSIALLYHDAVLNEDYDASGFPGKAASIYKLDINLMIEHFLQVKKIIKNAPGSIYEIEKHQKYPIYVTFDDGGKSFTNLISAELNKLEWVGHFFITTDYIGKESFVTSAEIRKLDDEGHIIGSHSCSHPHRMSQCTSKQIEYEWKESIAKLSDILGRQVSIASVPGGYYSKAIGKIAAECGIKFLFNSEPVKKSYYVDGCLIIGRFNILNHMSPVISGRLASNKLSQTQLNQLIFWKIKSLAKKVGGNQYLKFRELILKSKSPAS